MEHRRWAEVGAPLLAAIAVTALVLGTLLGWLVFADRSPSDTGADAGFARDMSEHHAQAVEMSLLALERTEDLEIRTLAYDIATSQGNQLGQMEAWLRQWELPMARSGDRMAWMDGHDHAAATEASVAEGGAPMPGMATDAEMERLRAAQGQEADVLFLQLMTSHHLGGVDMAQAAVTRASDAEVLRLASAMATAQASEIELMVQMLADRGAAPQESLAELGLDTSGRGDDAEATSEHDAEATSEHDH